MLFFIKAFLKQRLMVFFFVLSSEIRKRSDPQVNHREDREASEENTRFFEI